MENNLLTSLEMFEDELRRTRARSYTRLSELDDYSSCVIKQTSCVNNIKYYSEKDPDTKKWKYLGNQKKERVIRIQEAKYLSELINTLDEDISLIEKFRDSYKSIAFASITKRLPLGYRNDKALSARNKKRVATTWKARMEREKAKYEPYKPEELNISTVSEEKVRSKSEGLIYNYLYEHGYTFVYELPLKGSTRMFYPDFTILSEIDYKTVIRIEHQGMMSDEEYRKTAQDREYDYWFNGYLPNRDVYFTFDDNRGGFDIKPVIDILNSRIRPLERSTPSGLIL